MMTADVFAARFGAHIPGLQGASTGYAVLELLVQRETGLHLVFEVRAPALRQGGEVCFPGGRMEPGESAAACALRETAEELGIPASEIRILGTPDFIASPRGYLVQPVLGIVSPEGFAGIRPSPDEVAEVFTVPLDFFLTHAPEVYTYDLLPRIPPGFPYAAVGISPNYPWATGRVDVPVWHYDGHVIWGLTARLIRDLVKAVSGEKA